MDNQSIPTEEVELELAERQADVERYEAMKLLYDETTPAGKAFKTLILDGYMREKAVELTSLLAVPSMQQHRSHLFEKLAGISHFENYLHMVENLGAPINEDEE